MKTSEKGIELIKKYEGLKLSAYLCTAGVWTIGYGHTKNVRQGQKINIGEAERLLKEDLKAFEKGINDLNLKINQNQFDALVSFAFNVGLENLKKSTLLKKIKANPMDKSIENEFMRWVYAGSKKLDGLIKRRTEEAEMYFKEG